jgi:hypothetical protein
MRLSVIDSYDFAALYGVQNSLLAGKLSLFIKQGRDLWFLNFDKA